MSEINIKLLSDEALETVKGNVDKFTTIVKNNPNNSDVFIAELPDGCFVEKKYFIEDFSLKVDPMGNYSNVDFENSIMLFEHLNNLPKYILGDERFWMWIMLEKAYAAGVQAMPMESGENIIRDHWLFGQGYRRGLMFGVLSRAYYRVQLTLDENLEDKYELTRFATENYKRYREFTWRAYSNNTTIIKGALKAEKSIVEKYGIEVESIKDFYTEIAKFVSKLGSVMLLDFMSEQYITDAVTEFCEELVKKK